MDTRTKKITDQLYAGPILDHPGAVLLVGDAIVRLTGQQCTDLAKVLTVAAAPRAAA